MGGVGESKGKGKGWRRKGPGATSPPYANGSASDISVFKRIKRSNHGGEIRAFLCIPKLDDEQATLQ